MVADGNDVNACFPWGAEAKVCGYCDRSAAVLFCRTEKIFMCAICDGASGAHSGHERVWMCEVCEQAPARVICKADAAELCLTCDRSIHSANPLARRHDCSAVVPFYESPQSGSKSAAGFLVPNSQKSENSNGDFDFDYPFSVARCHQFDNLADSTVNDSVVPVQLVKQIIPPTVIDSSLEIPFEIDFTKSDFNSFSFPAQSLSHSVSSSSMDVGLVPDWNSMTDISYPFALRLNNNSDKILSSASESQSQPTQLSRLDREARVMRYKEKRKNRKFEKRIRYASRKAYAEARPRIKGRFIKRKDTENNVDHRFTPSSTTYFSDSMYGIVPSFYGDEN